MELKKLTMNLNSSFAETLTLMAQVFAGMFLALFLAYLACPAHSKGTRSRAQDARWLASPVARPAVYRTELWFTNEWSLHGPRRGFVHEARSLSNGEPLLYEVLSLHGAWSMESLECMMGYNSVSPAEHAATICNLMHSSLQVPLQVSRKRPRETDTFTGP